MSRGPDHPPPTLQDYLDAGLTIRSFCSGGQGHSHVLDLTALIAERGPDVEVDYVFRRSLTCPECGAPGGGLEIGEE